MGHPWYEKSRSLLFIGDYEDEYLDALRSTLAKRHGQQKREVRKYIDFDYEPVEALHALLNDGDTPKDRPAIGGAPQLLKIYSHCNCVPIDAARRAVAADDQDAIAHTVLSIYELFANRHDDAIKRLKRAVELDPNSSFALGNLGVALSFGGEPDSSIAALEEAKRLSPRDYLMVIWYTASAWSHLHAERFAEAMNCAKQAIEFNPNFPELTVDVYGGGGTSWASRRGTGRA